MSLFISQALAATDTAAQQPNPWGSVIMLAGFVLIFYFLLWRPQSRRAKEQRDLINSIQKDDEVVTSGGILGTITDVKENIVTLRIAAGCDIKVQKSAIANALPKGTIQSS